MTASTSAQLIVFYYIGKQGEAGFRQSQQAGKISLGRPQHIKPRDNHHNLTLIPDQTPNFCNGAPCGLCNSCVLSAELLKQHSTPVFVYGRVSLECCFNSSAERMQLCSQRGGGRLK